MTPSSSAAILISVSSRVQRSAVMSRSSAR
jgi:hypothetical protein